MKTLIVAVIAAFLLSGCAEMEAQRAADQARWNAMTPQQQQVELQRQQLALQQQQLGMQQMAAGAAILQQNAQPPRYVAPAQTDCSSYGYGNMVQTSCH